MPEEFLKAWVSATKTDLTCMSCNLDIQTFPSSPGDSIVQQNDLIVQSIYHEHNRQEFEKTQTARAADSVGLDAV